MVFNEFQDSWIRLREPGVLYKLDLEKGYDHINWEFLLYMLKRRGFGEKWRVRISHCISRVRFFILFNGSPSGFFSSSHGLKQGILYLLYCLW